MSLETDLFKKLRPDIKKLSEYGFVCAGECWTYEKLFAEGTMKAVITIVPKGIVKGAVIDTLSNEEYIAVHLAGQKGSYAAKIRSAYLDILSDIADQCFIPVPFVYDQTNRLDAWIKQTYGISFEHPFSKFPEHAAYYHPENRKWFALVQRIDRSSFSKMNGECEIVNLKYPKEEENIIDHVTVFPGYHMVKDQWITVVLDDTLHDDVLTALIKKSYEGTSGTKNKEIHDWLIPANPDYFDIDHAFAQSDKLYWKQSSNVHIGDHIYMYLSKPFAEIRYLCEVIEINVPADYDGKVKIKKMMRLKKQYQYKNGKLDLHFMKRFGVGPVRGPRSIPDEMKTEIERIYPDSIQKEGKRNG